MSWLNDLYLTYEACKSEIGIVRENQPILIPIAHSTQNAQIEIILSADGCFKRAERIDKADAVTVIPVTEDSGSRSGSAVYPHPLADKLEYLAGDYVKYIAHCKTDKFPVYLEQLKKWASSPYALPQIISVLKYVSRKSVIRDLIQSGNISIKDGEVVGEKQQGIDPKDWFVRFSVEIPGNSESRLYCSKEVFESYIQFYLSEQNTQNLCYVSGEMAPCSEKHPSKIRNTGDKAKLISANDASGFFTYKGRFSKSSQAAMVSYEISQKAHNALRWLIAKQAILRVGEQVFLAWSMEKSEMENVFAEFAVEIQENKAYTDDEYARQVKKAIWSSKELPKQGDKVIVMGVEAATTGRLSVLFYQKYEAIVFTEKIAKWKTETRWTRRKEKDLTVEEWSPSLISIVKLLVGDKNDKLNKCMRERLLPCIIEGRKLPYDVVFTAVQKAINRMHFDSYIEWTNNITIACALLRKWQIESRNTEEYSMELKEDSTDRSFIFGQLLATAEMLERSAFSAGTGKGIERNTAAEKYFVRFQRYPVQTWEIIRNQLQPYIMKLTSSGKGFYVEKVNCFSTKLDMTDKSKLEPTFLQGYSTQMMIYREHINQMKKENKEEEK